LTSVPAAPSSSAGTQRDGRSWGRIARLEGRGVAHEWAGCAPCLFSWTGLTGLWTGLTGGYVENSMHTSLTGGVKTEPVELI
jgi:hypothetical protein